MNPTLAHWLGVKWLLCYLKRTMHIGHSYYGTHFDSTSFHNSQHSTSGYIFQLDCLCIISWQSIKQLVVVLCSTKAEYIDVATTTKELLWLQAIVSKLQYSLQLSSITYFDNQSYITLSENPKYHDRSKHIDMHYHFLRERKCNLKSSNSCSLP